MFYAITTSKYDETFFPKGHVAVSRKGWKDASKNEKVRHSLERFGYSVVIAEFPSAVAARAYVEGLRKSL